ncbi:predicted protein [Naegleria gruberi]|uniref:Predicted protein n=1 Tax=Naegleria gruberi TaxID=5762 RepID=D2V4I4_NAEGR|nr:uncharacterized protein NAEGRDRAFT_63741 [Naegleria gruberi]EFC48390.1 predicted protein [Naegleria gruberi]|eukprot:XP_002681134.1 predicted protein [Naegleria gruberi strain NEG-M]
MSCNKHNIEDNTNSPSNLVWQSITNTCSDTENLPSGGGIAHCCVDHERVAFFGGLGLRRYNELYIFNVNTNEWKKASLENAPSKRCKSSMCCYITGNKHKLIIFGGWTSEGKTNDMHEYCIEDDKWKEVKYANNSVPPARSAHHCAIIGKHMIIYAGIGAKKFGDMYRFHLEKV